MLISTADEVLDLVESTGILGILLDFERVALSPMASHVAKMPEYYASRNADTRIRVAVLLPERGDKHGLAKYYKLSASKVGYTVQLFEAREDACDWLQRETKGKG